MSRTLALLLGITPFLGAAIGPPDSHNVASDNTSQITSLAVSLSTVPAKDLITCEVMLAGNANIPNISVSDSTNGAYSVAVPLHENSTIGSTYGVFYFQNSAAAAGGLVVTLSWDIASYGYAIGCQAWPGAATSSALDISSVQQQDGNSNYPISGGATLPSQNGELVIGYMGCESCTNVTPDPLYTSVDSDSSVSHTYPEYSIQTTATYTQAEQLILGGDNWTNQMAAFLPAPTTAVTCTLALLGTGPC